MITDFKYHKTGIICLETNYWIVINLNQLIIRIEHTREPTLTRLKDGTQFYDFEYFTNDPLGAQKHESPRSITLFKRPK